jgi:hypothetical protein
MKALSVALPGLEKSIPTRFKCARWSSSRTASGSVRPVVHPQALRLAPQAHRLVQHLHPLGRPEVGSRCGREPLSRVDVHDGQNPDRAAVEQLVRHEVLRPHPQRYLGIAPKAVVLRGTPEPHGRTGPSLADLPGALQHAHPLTPNAGLQHPFPRPSCSMVSSRLQAGDKPLQLGLLLLELLQPPDLHSAHPGELLLAPGEHRLGHPPCGRSLPSPYRPPPAARQRQSVRSNTAPASWHSLLRAQSARKSSLAPDQVKKTGPGDATPEDIHYPCEAASGYFKRALAPADVAWTYSGVRLLYDDGSASAQETTRDYVLTLDTQGGAPLLRVFGGKITTYRCLAEGVLAKLATLHPGWERDAGWTGRARLPGGDFACDEAGALAADLRRAHPFVGARFARHLVRHYGTEARVIPGTARDGRPRPRFRWRADRGGGDAPDAA